MNHLHYQDIEKLTLHLGILDREIAIKFLLRLDPHKGYAYHHRLLIEQGRDKKWSVHTQQAIRRGLTAAFAGTLGYERMKRQPVFRGKVLA